MQIKTSLILDALRKMEASSQRAFNNVQNPIIKECHAKDLQDCRSAISFVQTLPETFEILTKNEIKK